MKMKTLCTLSMTALSLFFAAPQSACAADTDIAEWDKVFTRSDKVDVKKVMGLLAEVMLENKRLVQEKIQYQNELEEYSKKNADAVKHRDEIDKALDYIASKLFCCQPLMLEINNRLLLAKAAVMFAM